MSLHNMQSVSVNANANSAMVDLSSTSTFQGRVQYIANRFFSGQMAMCYQLGLSAPSQLRRYLRGQGFPSYQVLESLWEYGISIDWVVSGRGSLFANNEAGSRLQLQTQLQDFGPIKPSTATPTLDNTLFNMPPAPAGSLFNPEAPSHQQTQAAAV